MHNALKFCSVIYDVNQQPQNSSVSTATFFTSRDNDNDDDNDDRNQMYARQVDT